MSGAGQQDKPREPGVIFHPVRVEEYNIPNTPYQPQPPTFYGTRPRWREFICGECGSPVQGRVVADLLRKDGDMTLWCLCPCEGASVILERNGNVIRQSPVALQFTAAPDWPTTLKQLYEEAAKSHAANAHTAAAMVCRKVLMVCACEKGAKDGLTFTQYVDHITKNVLTFPAAQNAIDAIRGIGNDANHQVAMVNQADAERAMRIVTYMLNTIYSFPAA